MARIVRNRRTGKQVVLLNPAEKSRKYAIQLRTKVAMTNDGTFKVDKRGNYIGLTNCQLAFRGGYLQARKDNARAFKHNRRRRHK